MQEQFTSQFAIKFTSQWNPLGKSEKSAAVDAAVAIFGKYQDRVGLRGTYVHHYAFTLRWENWRSNTDSEILFLRISTEPPAIIQPLVRR